MGPVFVHPSGAASRTATPATWWLHDAAASRAVEQQALAAAPPRSLMAAAGLSVARLALARWPHVQRVQVLAGPGHNGGDGWVAARHLHLAGRRVGVVLLADAARLPPDAAAALADAVAAGVRIDDLPSPGAEELVIDALLGLGARRPPDGAMAAAMAAIGQRPVLAVDLPSGLHPDTGMPLGEHAVRADATLSLLTLKPGLFTGHGRDLAGEVWFDDLGVDAAAPTACLAGAPPAEGLPRRHATHKGSFGDVAVVGGAPGMVGAAWLAARAALAAGAGRVYCSLLDDDAAAFDPGRPELMGRRHVWTASPVQLAALTVVCGCGGGDAVRHVLPALLAHAGRLLLDADALNAVAADTALRSLLQRRGGRGLPTVLTPHPLEAARLLGADTATVQADRLAAAQRLAERFAATVVLKGSGSVVASAHALPSINPTGNALLASAGSGDVLSGWTGGLWAQRAGAAGLDPTAVVCDAVWSHGHAADRAAAAGRRHPLLAADLVDALGGT